MNPKAKGEKGERIAIGELAKWDIDVAIPLTDNLPWDFVVIYQGRLFRVQVKSSELSDNHGSITFSLVTNNWHKGTTKRYYEDDCDLMILCDYRYIYLLGPDDFAGRNAFTIRHKPSRNRQRKGVNFHEDFVISRERIEKVLAGANANVEQNSLRTS